MNSIIRNRIYMTCAVSALLLSLLLCIPKKTFAVDGEITYTGTNTGLSGDDVSAGPFNIGFSFNFYNATYTTAYININGTVNFGSGYSRYANVPLSTALSGTNIADNSIYAFWDDLNTNGAQNIYYATVGTAPNRMFVTQWTNIYFHGTTIQMGTFQAILYEGSNVVQIQYRDLLGGDRALGNSATVGIRKNNTTSSQYLYNTASLTQEQAIRYTPDGSGGYTVNTSAPYELVYLAPAGAPTSPTLVNPSNGSTGVTLRPTFEWLAVDSATSYTVLISTVSNFSSTVVNQTGVVGTSYTLGSDLSPGTNYYWRIQAVNSNGSSLSPTRSFTTGSANTAPNTPSNVASQYLSGGATTTDAMGKTMTATLSDPDDAEQVRYRVQIATENTFASPLIDYRSGFGDEGDVTYTMGQSGGTYLVGSATTTLSAGQYYVRIRAEDDAAASSAWYTISGVAFTIVTDGTAPSVSSVSVDPEETSATVYWTTDEEASSQVAYGPSATYVATTTEYDTSPRMTSHSVVLTGLDACITYQFRVSSRDAANNRSYSANAQFTTKGCTGAAEVLSQTAESVSTSTGATIALVESDSTISIDVPPLFSSTSAHFQIKKIADTRVLASTSVPTGYQSVGLHTYALHAVTDDQAIIESFDQPITITLTYVPADIVGIDPSTLKIYRWNGLVWSVLSSCVVDTSAKTVTCTTDHFSTFSLFGQAAAVTPTPTSTNTTSTGSRSESASIAYGCRDITARNYSDFVTHKPELCVYENKKAVSLFTKNLRFGNVDIDVKRLQIYLNTEGYTVATSGPGSIGRETTKFGSSTKAALIAFQKAYKITPTHGIFGPLTRKVINEK
mgnify:CR=1 FL=1